MSRVVVTGIGAVTPLGNSFSRSWDALKAGKSGIGQITRFDVSHLPWKVAGELKEFDPAAYLSPKEIRRLDPFIHYAVAASVMAVEDAGLITSNLASAGIIIGSSRGGISTIEKALVKSPAGQVKETKDSRPPTACLSIPSRLSPFTMPSTTVSMAASYVAQKLGIKGHCLGISNACASGTNAIGEAYRLVKSGYAPLVVAGGTEAPLSGLCLEGYGIAGALSKCARGEAPDVPRPFDRKRDGFVLAEGACVMVLEDYEFALKRGAHIYGKIVGYGNSTDAFHMTRPDPEGEKKAIAAAMKEAGITPDEVDYINTHGTATKIGDSAEALAIRTTFGDRASVIPASAAKSMTGHMLAASGAFEAAATLMSIKECLIPPTINLEERDPTCDIAIMREQKDAYIGIAISHSFGFGGVNAVIILGAL